MNEHEPHTENNHGEGGGARDDREKLERTADHGRLEQTSRRFQDRITGGIAEAKAIGTEISDTTARLICHVLGRAYGRDSALAEFGRSGQGEYETLRDEYLPLWADTTAPPEVRTWVNWLGTYLVRRENMDSRAHRDGHDGSGQEAPSLETLLVRTDVTVNGQTYTVNLPAKYGQTDIADLEDTLALLRLPEDEALQAFLSLPDVNAMNGDIDIMESFHESFVSSYGSYESVIHHLLPVDDWEMELASWCDDHGLPDSSVSLNLSPDTLLALLRTNYDLVDGKEGVHVFYK